MLNLLKKPPLATVRLAAPGDMRQRGLVPDFFDGSDGVRMRRRV